MITCPFCLFDYDVSSSLGFAAYLDHPCFSEMVGGDGFILAESAQSTIGAGHVRREQNEA